jgi:hypothetical protein
MYLLQGLEKKSAFALSDFKNSKTASSSESFPK